MKPHGNPDFLAGHNLSDEVLFVIGLHPPLPGLYDAEHGLSLVGKVSWPHVKVGDISRGRGADIGHGQLVFGQGELGMSVVDDSRLNRQYLLIELTLLPHLKQFDLHVVNLRQEVLVFLFGDNVLFHERSKAFFFPHAQLIFIRKGLQFFSRRCEFGLEHLIPGFSLLKPGFLFIQYQLVRVFFNFHQEVFCLHVLIIPDQYTLDVSFNSRTDLHPVGPDIGISGIGDHLMKEPVTGRRNKEYQNKDEPASESLFHD